MTTYSTDFGEWLRDKELGSYLDGSGDLIDSAATQNFFSVQYTAWLTEIVNAAQVREYLSQNGHIDGDDVITVELNQNSSDGVPYIRINGEASNALDEFFSEREGVLLKTGKVTQLRYYSDVFTLADSNSAPELADTTDPAAVEELADASAQDIAPLTGSFAVSDADVGDTLTASIVGAPEVKLNGTTITSGYPTALTATGAFTLSPLTQTSTGGAGTAIGWTYDPGAADLDFLRAGQNLTITYQVKVNDGTADSAVQDVTITITGKNDAVVLEDTSNPDAVAELADASAQDIAPLTGSFAVSDQDVGDTLTPSVVGNPVVRINGTEISSGYPAALTAAGAFTLSDTPQTSTGGAGTAIGWTYDPGAANLDFLREGQSLTITYQVKVNDGTTDSAIQDVTITIAGKNDAPVTAADKWFVSDGTTATFSSAAALLGNDYDRDAGETLKVTALSNDGSLWKNDASDGTTDGVIHLDTAMGTLAVNTGTGAITYVTENIGGSTPSDGTDAFYYQATDDSSNPLSTTGAVTVTVKDVGSGGDTVNLSAESYQVSFISSGSGADGVTGGSTGGIDTFLGGSDIDTLRGGFGNDIIFGGQGNDLIYGNGGDDIIYNSDNHDTFYYLSKLDGNDIIRNDYPGGASAFDADAGGNGQDKIDLDGLFDTYGTLTGSRADHVKVFDAGNDTLVLIDTDNSYDATDNATYEMTITLVGVADSSTISVGADVLVGS